MRQIMALAGSFPASKGNITSKSQWGMKSCADKAEGALQRLSSVAWVWTSVRGSCQDDFKVNQAHIQGKASRGLLLLSSYKHELSVCAKGGINPNPADVSKSDFLAHLLPSTWSFLSLGLVWRRGNKILFSAPQSVWKCQGLQPRFQMLLILLEA